MGQCTAWQIFYAVPEGGVELSRMFFACTDIRARTAAPVTVDTQCLQDPSGRIAQLWRSPVSKDCTGMCLAKAAHSARCAAGLVVVRTPFERCRSLVRVEIEALRA